MAMIVKNKNLVVVDFGFGCGQVFGDQFAKVSSYKHAAQIDSQSVVVFEGGNDISPELYGEPKGSWTQPLNTRRDDLESSVFAMARYRGAAFIGICRGAQLLTALNGGKLFQDVTGHYGTHHIKTDTGKVMFATSVHHQMMNPFVLPESDFKLVAWAKGPPDSLDGDALSYEYLDGEDNQAPPPPKEPEVVWYPKTKSLCIQGHPEFAAKNSPFYQYCKALVNRFILKQE